MVPARLQDSPVHRGSAAETGWGVLFFLFLFLYIHIYIPFCSSFLTKTSSFLVLLLLACLCNTALLTTNNINKSEALPTIAEYSQGCPIPQLDEQCVNFVMSELSVSSVVFFNFWKNLSRHCVLLNKIISHQHGNCFNIDVAPAFASLLSLPVGDCRGVG